MTALLILLAVFNFGVAFFGIIILFGNTMNIYELLLMCWPIDVLILLGVASLRLLALRSRIAETEQRLAGLSARRFRLAPPGMVTPPPMYLNTKVASAKVSGPGMWVMFALAAAVFLSSFALLSSMPGDGLPVLTSAAALISALVLWLIQRRFRRRLVLLSAVVDVEEEQLHRYEKGGTGK